MDNLSIKSGIGQMTDTIINQIICEINKKENKEKLNMLILNPIINKINKKIYPYFLIFSILIILILILIIIILYILIK